MNDHTVKAFDNDIGQLRGLISQMGGLAEDAIAQAMKALQRPDPELARRVRADDKAIDAIAGRVEIGSIRCSLSISGTRLAMFLA